MALCRQDAVAHVARAVVDRRTLHEFQRIAKPLLVFQLTLYGWIKRGVSKAFLLFGLLDCLPEVCLVLLLLRTCGPSCKCCAISLLQAILVIHQFLFESHDATRFITVHCFHLLSRPITLRLHRSCQLLLLSLHHLCSLEPGMPCDNLLLLWLELLLIFAVLRVAIAFIV